MKYLDKIYFGEPCNYEMAFYEYTKQMKNSSMQKFDRQIAMKAMEHLEVWWDLHVKFYSWYALERSRRLSFVSADSGTDSTSWRSFSFKGTKRICCLQHSRHVRANDSRSLQIPQSTNWSETVGRHMPFGLGKDIVEILKVGNCVVFQVKVFFFPEKCRLEKYKKMITDTVY